VDWTWFEKGGPLVSPGDRRALIVAFVEAPALVERDGAHWLEFALPRGSFATQLLAALDLDGR
jgi:tRNA(Glu) U13 pseudouridine synthase TruD